MEISPFYKIKALYVGESSVGKSSLVHLIHNDTPILNTEPTIGMGFACTQFELEEYPLSNPSKLPNFYYEAKKDFPINVSNNTFQLVKLQCWDCSGSQRFSQITNNYMRDVDICFLVFDLSDRSSWERIPMWKEKVTGAARYDNFPMFVLIGTKSDLKSHEVSLIEIKERCDEWHIKHFILTAVQESSSSMFKRMLYKTVQEFHDMLLKCSYENKPLPPHVTTHHLSKRIPIVDLSVEGTPGYCCNIL